MLAYRVRARGHNKTSQNIKKKGKKGKKKVKEKKERKEGIKQIKTNDRCRVKNVMKEDRKGKERLQLPGEHRTC